MSDATLEKIIDTIYNQAANIAIKLLGALIIILVGRKIIKLIKRGIQRSKKSNKISPTAKAFLSNFIGITCNVLLIITAAAVMGVPMTSIVALLGSAGIAIGLALQGGLSNFAGCLIILLFKPFGVGDLIDTGTYVGKVKDIDIFYTTVITPDNRHVAIPNGAVAYHTVVNISREKTRRVDIEVRAAYSSDIDQVTDLLLKTANRDARVIYEPGVPYAALLRQGEDALVFILQVWCAAGDYAGLLSGLNKNIVEEFRKNGINIPTPQMEVRLKPGNK